MNSLPPRSTRTYTLCPYTTLFRSGAQGSRGVPRRTAGNPVRQLRSTAAGLRLAGAGASRQAARWLPGGGEGAAARRAGTGARRRSEEHTSELQSLMRSSYAVFCLKKKKSISRDQNIHKTE